MSFEFYFMKIDETILQPLFYLRFPPNFERREMELHNIRDEYTKRALSQHDCHENPISQFEQWQKEAIHAQVNEPTAMNIATVD